MKIGIYDPYLDDMGGGEKYMLTIAECLSQDHDVTVFWDNKHDLDNTLQRFSIDLSRVKLSDNIFSSRIGLIKRVVESKKYDAIIFLSDGSIPFVLSKKLFIHFQQPIPGARHDIKTKIKLKRVSMAFCNSYFSKDFVDKSFGVNSLVIYPPVSLHPETMKKENMILHVGRFRVRNVGVSDYKKQSVMVGEFKKMVKKGLRGWKFVVVTGVKYEDEDEFNKLKETAKNYPVEFFVNKSNNALWDLYSRAKIYWHASGYGEDLEKHPEYAEHFGISTVEAMGAGAVPVVINAGGQKEIVKDGLSGFLWNSLSELQEKTLLLTRENVILEKMSKLASKRARGFTGTRFCEEIRRLIEG